MSSVAPDGAYLCRIEQVDVGAWTTSCIALKLKVIAPEEFADWAVNMRFTVPTPNNGPASMTTQQYYDLRAAVPDAFSGNRYILAEFGGKEVVVRIIDGKAASIRHRTLWEKLSGPPKVRVADLRRPAPVVAKEVVSDDEIDAERFRNLDKT